MLISARAVRILLEALERCRIEPAPILEAVGLDRRALASDRHSIPWTTFVRLNAEVAAAVDGDHGRLHLIGRATVETLSLGALRRIGRTVVSAPALYDIAYRWFARSNFPHIRLLQRIDGDRVTIHGFIPMSYEGSGALSSRERRIDGGPSRILGLPASVPIDVRIDDRSLDLELRIPENTSLFRRARAAVGAVLNRRERAVLPRARAPGARRRARRVVALEGRAARRPRADPGAGRDPRRGADSICQSGARADARLLFARRARGAHAHRLGRPALARSLREAAGSPRRRILRTTWSRPGCSRGAATRCSSRPLRRRPSCSSAPARLVVGRDIGERDRLHKQLATADRLAALGLLAAGVAHEVNNPLAYLLNNIEIAQKELAALGTGGEKARSALDIAIEGRIAFQLHRSRAAAARARSLRSTRARTSGDGALDAGARARGDREDGARGDRARLGPAHTRVGPRVAQIVLNLVLNSVEAMRYDASRNELAVRVRRSGEERVLLEVTDNGVGVEGRTRRASSCRSSRPRRRAAGRASGWP